MNNRTRDAIRKEAEYLAQSAIHTAQVSNRLEAARTELVEAYLLMEPYARTMATETRATIRRIDITLEALHDARGQS
jgi:uncharacterized membrane protein